MLAYDLGPGIRSDPSALRAGAVQISGEMPAATSQQICCPGRQDRAALQPILARTGCWELFAAA
jgi:hypothetical protein